MKAIKISLSFLLFLFAIKIVAAQPGALDPSFGNGGIVDLHPNFTVDQERDVAVTNDGKILMLSSNYSIGSYLIRLNSNGTLDTSFGEQGKLPILQDGDINSTSIEVDNTNRILVCTNYSGYFDPSIALYRYLQNGAKDSSFGYNGKKITALSKANRAMIIQADGKIVVGGQNNNSVATVQRLNTDGSTDITFHIVGSNSLMNLPDSYIFSLRQQPDGKLLATGTADGKMFIARFNTDGNLDITFNNTGYKTFSGTGLMAGQDVVTMPDDKILIVGHVESETESSMLCWKLLPNGSPDNSFGNNGVDTLYTGSENNFAWFAFSNNDSTAIVGGSIFNGLVYQPVLYQLLNDGSLDNSFGLSGVAGKTFDCGKSIQVNGAITFDGKIIYSSTAFENGNNLIGVSQFLSDGNADGSFANNGSISLASVDSIPPDDIIQDFTVLADGKIFCAGINNENRLLYFRIDTNGTLDPTYGVNGYYVPNQRVSTTGFEFNDPGCIIASNELNIFVAQNCLSIRLGDEDLVDLKGSFGVILHKMDTKGNPDSTFGEGGRLRLNFPNQGEDAIECTDLKFQSNGKLLFGAHETHDNGILYGTDNWVFLERLNTDGTIDSTFATNGTQSLNKQEETGLLLLSIREDDKINCLYSYFISRLMPNGSVDSTFLDNCNDSIELGGGSAYQFLLQNDNKMLILILYSYGYYGFQILRYNEEGTVDSAFAINGFLNLSFLNYGVLGCQIQIDNKILACNGQVNGDISVARYFNDGLFDTAFGVNGIANFGGGMLTGANKYLIREQFDGKILIAQKHSGVFFLARLLSGTGTSIDELVNSSLLHIYPNPTTKQLIINDPLSTIEQGVISIADLSGKIIISEIVRFNNNNVIIPVEDLSDGIYFLTLQTENNIQTTKFVKQ